MLQALQPTRLALAFRDGFGTARPATTSDAAGAPPFPVPARLTTGARPARRTLVRALHRALVVAAGTVGISTIAVGQSTAPVRRDSAATLPFHGGQWGMDFGVSGGSTYRIGAVRFTSPTRAWILDGRLNGHLDRWERWPSAVDSAAGYPSTDAINQGGSFSLLVGRRAYRPLGTRAMRTMSFAVGGGLGYGESLDDGRRIGHGVNWNGTAEWALGGHYRVTPALALGATLRLGATYNMFDNRSIVGSRDRRQGLDVGLGTSDLVLSLFF